MVKNVNVGGTVIQVPERVVIPENRLNWQVTGYRSALRALRKEMARVEKEGTGAKARIDYLEASPDGMKEPEYYTNRGWNLALENLAHEAEVSGKDLRSVAKARLLLRRRGQFLITEPEAKQIARLTTLLSSLDYLL
jgi:hypothetical protein